MNHFLLFIGFLRTQGFLLGLFAVIAVGLNFPQIGTSFQPWISKLIFCSMTLIGLRLDFSQMMRAASNFKAVSTCLFAGFCVMPLISLALAEVFFADNREMYVGVILAAAVPTTQASSLVWTDLSKGDKALAFALMAVSNFLGVFLAPVILERLLGTKVELPVFSMIQSLATFILLPVLIAQLVKLLYLPSERVIKFSRAINVFVIWATVLAALANGNPVEIPLVTVFLVVALQYFSIAGFSFGISRAVGLSLPQSIAVMFCSAQVTVTFAAIVGFSFFDARSILYIVVYHIFQQAMGQITANIMEFITARQESV